MAHPKNYIPPDAAPHYNARLSKFSAPDRRGMLIAFCKFCKYQLTNKGGKAPHT